VYMQKELVASQSIRVACAGSRLPHSPAKMHRYVQQQARDQFQTAFRLHQCVRRSDWQQLLETRAIRCLLHGVGSWKYADIPDCGPIEASECRHSGLCECRSRPCGDSSYWLVGWCVLVEDNLYSTTIPSDV